jgi:hypothetical protein
MQREASLPCWQESTAGLYPEHGDSSQPPAAAFEYQDFSATCACFIKVVCPDKVSSQNVLLIFYLACTSYMPSQKYAPSLHHGRYSWWRSESLKQCFSDCGPWRFRKKECFINFIRHWTSEKYIHTCLKLTVLVELRRKVGESVLSITSCPSIIILEIL